jgi:hypothetical protein
MQVVDSPRIAARFLLGNGHDVIEGPFATFLILAIVVVPPREFGETLAAVVRVMDGYVTDGDAEYADTPFCKALGGDAVFFYRTDDMVAARAR